MTLSLSVSVRLCVRLCVPFFSFSVLGVLSTSVKVFQWCFKNVSRVLEVSRMFPVSFEGVYKKFQGSLKGVSRNFQECFKEVSGKY